MAYKCLYTCGDSWTYGDEICDYTNVTVNDETIRYYNTWPWFLAQELGISIEHADIARICGISPVTIQKCLKRLQPWKEKLLEQ